MEKVLEEGIDYYLEGPFMVFTREYHLKRGACCGSQCRHCPYEPRWTKGAQNVSVQQETAAGEKEEL